ncbi:uroporphyrinogen decarboxylase [Demequina sp. TTPB684]|uniref:uroporphyrinogen decarboxylase n=1 Tax=unclassified Demequina TaxID=2620311 RepID=UPI001CF15871|nr:MULTISPECIES: uroporphyrinogen decarboxylase [unclassified Demequina]MCB2412529.1 uroporphyrinogen decarboxylase [Demequina sp. TTPB684]UPU87348.1 uroporphyrinogen decarboxylase [Demequina sp. TMPB413]
MTLPDSHPLVAGHAAASDLIRALRGDRPERTPVWFMRQAGRSLPEYRQARQGTTMLEACVNPALVAEITAQPVRRHGVDAGIFFSDIVVPLLLAGVDVAIEPGVGPVFGKPIAGAADIAALPPLGAAGDGGTFDRSLDVVRSSVTASLEQLGDVPLIGFAGAPFTLAAYMVEGRPSRDHLAARRLMISDPEAWDALMAWAADAAGLFLRAQVLAGASAVQLFDSWAGSLPRERYAAHCAPASAKAFAHVADLDVPRIHFGTHTGHLLEDMYAAGATAMGIDVTVPLEDAARRLPGVPLQGNIDPAVLGAPWEAIESHVRDVVTRGRAAPAHVVNLGHGVPPDADPAVLTRIVEFVHEL